MSDEKITTRFSVHGTFEVSLDSKAGRFNVPTDMEDLKLEQVNFTRDPLGRFLEFRRHKDYDAFAQRMEAAAATMDLEAAEALLVDYVGFTVQALVDQNLRLIIPKKMREYLGDTTSIVLVGIGDVVQIWPADSYNETKREREEVLRAAYNQFGRSIVVRERAAHSEEAA